jgi:hypothetical protein
MNLLRPQRQQRATITEKFRCNGSGVPAANVQVTPFRTTLCLALLRVRAPVARFIPDRRQIVQVIV